MKNIKPIKKALLIFCIVVISAVLFSCKQNNTCIINGKVIGVSNKAIVLVRVGESFTKEGVEVPINNDSTFHYEFELDYPEGCVLYLDNIRTRLSGMPMPFFLEPGEINITVYPESEFNKNIVIGGKLNKEYKEFEQDIMEFYYQYYSEYDSLYQVEEQLHDNNLYYRNSSNQELNDVDSLNEEEKKIIDYINSNICEEDRRMDYSKEVISIYTRFREINVEMNNWLLNKINEDLSFVSYYFFVDNIEYFEQFLDKSRMNETYESFVNTYPDHPYNELALNIINAIYNFKIGKKYTDFSAPDINGNLIILSEKIDNKIAIIDLWASWCSPCIQRSKELIPIYEEYKDKGFTIVGLANEYKNTKAFQERIEKDKYPWTNLYDLDGKYKVAEKYDGGLKTILIDKDGTILAINPSPEDIRKVLENKL